MTVKVEIDNFFKRIKHIKYGWYDKENNLHTRLNMKEFRKNYIMQSTSDILKNGYAICWEMCELERQFFDSINVVNKTIFAYLKNSNNECHTFLVFKLVNYWYWFEASWKQKKGIYKFTSLEEIFDFYRNNFSSFTKHGYKKEDLCFYSYDKVKNRLNCDQFYKHCLSSKILN